MRYPALIASAIALLFSNTLVIRADETADRHSQRWVSRVAHFPPPACELTY